MRLLLLFTTFLFLGSSFGQKDFDTLFGVPGEIRLDSITSQPITNEFLLGKWKFHSLELENKSLEKVLTENSEKLEFKFYIDHKMRWVDGLDTANVYWDLVPKEEIYDLRVYQPLEENKLHANPAVLVVHKLSRKKLIIQMSFKGVEELETPFYVIFKRK